MVGKVREEAVNYRDISKNFLVLFIIMSFMLTPIEVGGADTSMDQILDEPFEFGDLGAVLEPDFEFGITATDCFSLDEGGCNSNVNCSWDIDECFANCTVFLDETNCSDYPDECFWNNTGAFCEYNMSGHFGGAYVNKTSMYPDYGVDDMVEFMIEIVNDGFTNLTHVILDDEFNVSELAFNSSSCPLFYWNWTEGYVGINVTDCNPGVVIEPDGGFPVFINFTSIAAPPYFTTNEVTINVTDSDSFVTVEHDNETVEITDGSIDINFTKTSAYSWYWMNETVQFVINVTNKDATHELVNFTLADDYNTTHLTYDGYIYDSMDAEMSLSYLNESTGEIDWGINVSTGGYIIVYLNFTPMMVGNTTNYAFLENETEIELETDAVEVELIPLGGPGPVSCINITADDTYINNDTTLCGEFYGVTDAAERGVIIINASDIVLDCAGSTLDGAGPTGIYAHNLSGVTIKNCIIGGYGGFGPSACIEINDSIDFTIENNTIYESSSSGIVLRYVNNSRVTDNILHNVTSVGSIYVVDSHHNNITNNTAYDNKHGIEAGTATFNNFIGNHIYDNYNSSLYDGRGFGI
ncbi:right-handed parallel beta-helix repeat-containing protein, partial [Thermoproteota archaeon]